MLTSLYWRRTNKYGAIAGMLSGTATVLIWHNLVKPLGGIFAIYELLPAFIVSLLFIVVVSLLTPAPSAEVLHEFDHYLDDPDDRHVDDDLVAAESPQGRSARRSEASAVAISPAWQNAAFESAANKPDKRIAVFGVLHKPQNTANSLQFVRMLPTRQ